MVFNTVCKLCQKYYYFLCILMIIQRYFFHLFYEFVTCKHYYLKTLKISGKIYKFYILTDLLIESLILYSRLKIYKGGIVLLMPMLFTFQMVLPFSVALSEVSCTINCSSLFQFHNLPNLPITRKLCLDEATYPYV